MAAKHQFYSSLQYLATDLKVNLFSEYTQPGERMPFVEATADFFYACPMDRLTPGERSRNMARVRNKNTGPELLVRSLLHRMGYRFRLHAALPGKPDVVLPRYKAVIFVHGCFWHGHKNCRRAALPATRTEFWAEKIAGNAQRDASALRKLEELGYRPLVVWQCELKDIEGLRRRLTAFLSAGPLAAFSGPPQSAGSVP